MNPFQKIGFSIGDTVKLLWLYRSSSQQVNPKELHDNYEQLFPGRKVSYDYVARIAKRLEQESFLFMAQEKQRKFYAATPAGKEHLHRYEELYYNQFREVVKVLDRIHYLLTKQGPKPTLPEEPLHQDFRKYFAKLISVKDITRYMIFSHGQNREDFYVAEVHEQMNELIGWAPSNGYLYEIAREMEAEGTIIGRWKEPEKRTVRLVHVTDEGVVFSKQIAANLLEQVENVSTYLKSFVAFFE